MFSFTQPPVLLLALVVPPLTWWWLRQRRGALRYPDTGLLTHLPGGRSRLVLWAGALGRAAALLLLVVALAGPRWPDLRTRIPTEGIAIQMVVDVSGSMAEPDFHWDGKPISRLEAVKKAFHLFVGGGPGADGATLPGRPDDLIGLVTFATVPESPCPLTLSHSVLLELLEAQKPRTIPTESRTNIGDAIAWGLVRLESAGGRRRVMILLSDGEHNVPPPAELPRRAAQLAGNLQIPVYTIDAGGEVSSADKVGPETDAGDNVMPTPAQLRANGRKTLQNIARITGGKYFAARDTQALMEACRQIDELERQPIISYHYRRYHEGFVWFSLASLVFLVGVYGLEMTAWKRLP